LEAQLGQTDIALAPEWPRAEDVRKGLKLIFIFSPRAEVLSESSVSGIHEDEIAHRDQLAQAAAKLHKL
jgi:hypothetical protein